MFLLIEVCSVFIQQLEPASMPQEHKQYQNLINNGAE
jgi:hypothetical protein